MIAILKRYLGLQKKSEDESKTSVTIEDDKSSEAPYMIAVAFYLAVIIFIGLPVWFYTCSVTRYSTPILDYPIESLSLHLDISIIQLSKNSSSNSDPNDDEFNGDSMTKYLRSYLPKTLKTSHEIVTYDIDWRVRRPTYQESSIFRDHLLNAATISPKNDLADLANLERKLLNIHKDSSSKFRLFIYLIREQDHLAFCDRSRVHSYTINMERFVYLCPSSAISKPGDYSSVVSLVVQALEEVYSNTVDPSRAKQILDSRVDLLFTLVPEHMDYGDFDHMIALADKIHHIFERNVRQKLPELKNLVNIRPITQNFFDLWDDDILKKRLDSSSNRTDNRKASDSLQSNETRGIFVDDLNPLFRLFKSRLDRHSAKNVHDVILLVPKVGSTHMVLRDRLKKSTSSLNYLEVEDISSLLVADDDKTLVLGLRAIIRRLAGLSSVNICKSCLVRRDIFFCRWEIDAIMGTMTLMKLHSTHTSLKSINQQVMGIKIPKDVAATVRESHDLALKSIQYLKTQRPHEAYTFANRAYELSEAAFYDPSLLESLYFPDDLKYAIYLPFFLPLAYPILLSIVKLLKYCITNFSGYQRQKVKIQ